MSAIDESEFKPVIANLIRYYRHNLHNEAGGNLHIVLDDGNLSDSDIWFCQGQCKEDDDELGYLIGTVLRCFSEDEREVMYDADWKEEGYQHEAQQ